MKKAKIEHIGRGRGTTSYLEVQLSPNSNFNECDFCIENDEIEIVTASNELGYASIYLPLEKLKEFIRGYEYHRDN